MRIHVFISGYVQGVFFRSYTAQKAKSLDLAGWVRNLPDGRVEAVFEGHREKIEKMIKWCWQGSPASQVKEVEEIEEEERGLKNFKIRYHI